MGESSAVRADAAVLGPGNGAFLGTSRVLAFRPKTLILPARSDLAAIAAAFVPSPEWTAQLRAEFETAHPELFVEEA